MSSVYAPYDAFSFSKIYVKNTKLDDVEIRILDDALKYMWMAAPWRWTIGSLPTFTLVANTQDYTVTAPSDFLYLHSAYAHDGTTPPRPLEIEPALPTTTKYIGQPNRVAGTLVSSNVQMRISPVAPNFPGVAPTVISLYKKHAPTVTSGTASTVGLQVFDDEWFWVYQQGVLWLAYLYADDDRAGSVTFADGKVQYTGQRASFEAGLQFMRQNEKLFLPEKQKEP